MSAKYRGYFRRVAVLMLSVAMAFIMTSCRNENTQKKTTISVWVLSDEYSDCIKWTVDNYCKDKAWKAEISVVDIDNLQQKIDDSVCKGKIPDIIMIPPESIETLAVSGIITHLSEIERNIDSSRFYEFALNAGRVDEKLYAMCWHASPGLFAYRSSIANAYLGTDDPAEIEALISDTDSFIDVAQILKVSSLGNTYILADVSDITRSYWSGDFSNISDESAADYFEFAEKLYNNEYVYGAEQWSEAWIAGFNDSNAIFGYYLSDIAVNDVLFRVCNESAGDWRAAVPFSDYAWGGAYLSLYSGSDSPDESMELIKLLTTDENAMTRSTLYSGFFTANKYVNDSVSSDAQFESSVFGGQNYYKVLMRSAERLDEDSIQRSEDSMIISLLNTCARNYASGDYDLSAAIETFFTSLKSFDN